MAISCMHNASDRNYTNNSDIVDLAMGQIAHATENISSYYYYYVVVNVSCGVELYV